MAQPGCFNVVLLAATTATTSGTGPDIVLPQGFTSAIVSVTVATVSGTSPTLNVYLQNNVPQADSSDTSGAQPTGTAIYDDLASFTQVTASTSSQILRIVGGGNVLGAKNDAALSAGTVQNGPIAGTWRIKYVLTGTSPSFSNITVTAQLIP